MKLNWIEQEADEIKLNRATGDEIELRKSICGHSRRRSQLLDGGRWQQAMNSSTGEEDAGCVGDFVPILTGCGVA